MGIETLQRTLSNEFYDDQFANYQRNVAAVCAASRAEAERAAAAERGPADWPTRDAAAAEEDG